jgi:hypothetical protein
VARREVAEESKLVDFAEDLGRLLGTARGNAENWLNQRQQIVQNLTELRDTATKLPADMGHQAQETVVKRRGRPRKDSVVGVIQPMPPTRKQKRKMSADARRRISEAQKARWAAQNAGGKKK